MLDTNIITNLEKDAQVVRDVVILETTDGSIEVSLKHPMILTYSGVGMKVQAMKIYTLT